MPSPVKDPNFNTRTCAATIKLIQQVGQGEEREQLFNVWVCGGIESLPSFTKQQTKRKDDLTEFRAGNRTETAGGHTHGVNGCRSLSHVFASDCVLFIQYHQHCDLQDGMRILAFNRRSCEKLEFESSRFDQPFSSYAP